MQRLAGFGKAVLVLAATLLLPGCLAENEHTIVVDPVDPKPFQGHWIDARGDSVQIVSIKPDDDGRSAKATYAMINAEAQDAKVTPLRMQITAIGKDLYVEATGPLELDARTRIDRFIGRIAFGTPETPDDRDKITLCFAEGDALKPAVEKGALKGTLVRGKSSGLFPAPDKLRITASTAELRAYFAANPLQCSRFSWFVFVRARAHQPTNPVPR